MDGFSVWFCWRDGLGQLAADKNIKRNDGSTGEKKMIIVEVSLSASRMGVGFFLKNYEAKETANSYMIENPGMATPRRLAKEKLGEPWAVSKNLDGVSYRAYCLSADVCAVKKYLLAETHDIAKRTMSDWQSILLSTLSRMAEEKINV